MVWAKVLLPGFHRWPDAPPNRTYLAAKHRHLFHVTATVEVGHSNREVEFHDLHDIIRTWWGGTDLGIRDWGTASCEVMARELLDHLSDDHDLTPVRVEVSEDGEAGAIVESGP